MKRIALVAAILAFAACKKKDETPVDTGAAMAAAPADMATEMKKKDETPVGTDTAMAAVSVPKVRMKKKDETMDTGMKMAPDSTMVMDSMMKDSIMKAAKKTRAVASARDNNWYPGLPRRARIIKDSLDRVRVYYGTDRRREEGNPTVYGNRRGTLEYGQLDVTIPPGHHHAGELEGPNWYYLEFEFDPKKHVMLRTVVALPEREMFSRLARAVDSVSSHEVFVFVHGFNVTFQDAARRTAQIAYDLNLKAVPVMYSWPSQGTSGIMGYKSDAEVMDYTIPNLTTFLGQVAARSGAKKIHLLAHSMGSLALTKALLRATATSRPPIFQNVILAAPDIDADVFRRDIAPSLHNVARRVTVYASENDEALRVSAEVNSIARVGQAGPLLFVMQGIETVDASKIKTDWLGHSYVAGTKEVLDDLFAATLLDKPADVRNLHPETRRNVRYWVLP